MKWLYAKDVGIMFNETGFTEKIVRDYKTKRKHKT